MYSSTSMVTLECNHYYFRGYFNEYPNHVEIKSIFWQQHYILHNQTKRKILFHDGHMAHFVLSSCDPKTNFKMIYIYIFFSI